MTEEQDEKKGQPLALDATAASNDPNLPAFLSPPQGAPVYYGFPVLKDIEVGGFVLGKITDFDAEPCDYGDAFVVAPDGSRAGLVWEVSKEARFSEVCAEEPDRWGVWDVSFPHPMNSHENARKNLEAILPLLNEKWQLWKRKKQEDEHGTGI